jgi:hypothetical protein
MLFGSLGEKNWRWLISKMWQAILQNYVEIEMTQERLPICQIQEVLCLNCDFNGQGLLIKFCKDLPFTNP